MRFKKANILILTGPPGSGKSTVSQHLAEISDSPAVHLHTDDFYNYIAKGRIEPFLPEAHKQNETVIKAIVEAACCFAEGGYFVVVDGIIGSWFLDPFREATKSRSILLDYVILRPNLDITLHRAKTRIKGLKDEEPIKELHRQFQEMSTFEKYVIDSSLQDGRETIHAILEGMATEKFRLR